MGSVTEGPTITGVRTAQNGGYGAIVRFGDIEWQHFTKDVVRVALERIVEQLTKDWLELHGPETLEQLSPGVMAGAIKAKLEAEIAKKVLG